MQRFSANTQVWLAVMACWFCSYAGNASTDLNLGRELGEEERIRSQMHVFANGAGLPPGGGSVKEGELLYMTQCAQCHGSRGQGGRALELTGDKSLLNTRFPDRGIAVYWPYAPALFEYVRRSMPPQKPWSLSVTETYSVVAFLLSINGLVADETVVDKDVLSNLVMPNVDGFRTSTQ